LNTKDSITRPTIADPLDAQSLNPGNLRTNLNRHTAEYLKIIFNFLFVYPPIFGAYTELFAGLSPDAMNADWGKQPLTPLSCVQMLSMEFC
jgi:hypothetical protein